MAEQLHRDIVQEDPRFLREQIITYLGNKRALLGFIGSAVELVKKELNTDKLDIVDLFSGSGVVSRYFKKDARHLYSNDLEPYCETINRCYLTNASEVDTHALQRYYKDICAQLDSRPLEQGFISRLYAPHDDENIKPGERVFYTSRNAMYIDTARQALDTLPEPYKTFLLAPLLYEASVHTNTSGVFKGFYKNSASGIGQFGGDGQNALSRIIADISLQLPIFSRFECDVQVLREDACRLAGLLPTVDLVYMDPPYNQHPYGSNYFMLNLINDYRCPDSISRVSGIPRHWNRSQFNSKKSSMAAMSRLCHSLKAKYLLISFSNDGFISQDEMVELLSGIGDVRVFYTEYNTFRGCRNLGSRDIHVKELLYLVTTRYKG